MLPPLVFKPFLVLIEKQFARFVETDCFGRCTQYLFGTSTGYGYFIKLSHGRTGKEGAFGWVLNGGREEDVFTVGGKCGWDFSGRVGGQALGCSTVGWHYEYVEVTVSVTGKCYLLAVGDQTGVDS